MDEPSYLKSKEIESVGEDWSKTLEDLKSLESF